MSGDPEAEPEVAAQLAQRLQLVERLGLGPRIEQVDRGLARQAAVQLADDRGG